MLQPQVVLLKEGTDTSQGAPQTISNINACTAVADILRSTLGPMGMDKLIKKQNKTSISNDGATIINLLDIVHPAARTLAEIAQSQDKEIGDGTTSVVLLAAELLRNAKDYIEDGIAPQVVIKGYRKAEEAAIKILKELKVPVNSIAEKLGFKPCKSESGTNRFLLVKCAETALNSKLIEADKTFFAEILVDAFIRHNYTNRNHSDFFQVKTVTGGSVKDSVLVEGVAFKKTFSYAGFEQQPKKISSPKLALLNVELELKTEHISGEVRVSPSQYQAIVDAEWKTLYDKLNLIRASGARVVLSQLPIGDLATQFFAENDVFCAGRVLKKDLRRVATLTGGSVQTSLQGLLDKDALGCCELFEERQVGAERFNFFSGSTSPSMARDVVTLILRGGAEQYVEEASRSLHDALMVVKNTVRCPEIVAGGGATEMEISKRLKVGSRECSGKSSLMLAAFAKSLEVIPRSLALNAGIDATDILNDLRSLHHKGDKHAGVDIKSGTAKDCLRSFVWEPFVSKRSILHSATEAACLVLSVDETLRVPKNDGSVAPAGGLPSGAPAMMPPGGGMMR